MKPIQSAAVLGSGVMGAQIAAHFANCGIPVWLLDLPAEEKRNFMAERAIAGLKKLKPSPLYTQSALALIRAGNFEDHLAQAGRSDWIVEAIVEKAEPKISLFEKLAPHLGPDSILSTNTSGIELSQLSAKFSQKMKKKFLATHFFNPPRYLRLVEIITTADTDKETVDRVRHLLETRMNKEAVPAKDVPCFIANRIGVHALLRTIGRALELGLTVEETDKLTGSLLGRPKSGTFRLADVVGLDTLYHIIENLSLSLPAQERSDFQAPEILVRLVKEKRTGQKSGLGFYKKEKKEILGIDLKSGEYRPGQKPSFDDLKPCFKEDDLSTRFSLLFDLEGRGAQAARLILTDTLLYAAKVAPAVSENLADVDKALELGFGWDMGPFKILDSIGWEKFEKALGDQALPAWLGFCRAEGQPLYTYHQDSITIPAYSGGKSTLPSSGFDFNLWKKNNSPVFTTSSASLWDVGDGICQLEFHSKMNSQDLVSLQAILTSVEVASRDFLGLVIGNQGHHFCTGANIAMVLMDAVNGEFENVDFAIKQFQAASMAIKYSPVPVIVSPHGMALGGGCEFVMHSNRPVVSPETYMGLVEVGVGLLPAGGGTKELTLRALESETIPLKSLAKYFELIAMGKVATSAKEALELGLLDKRAIIAGNESSRLHKAKSEALGMSLAGYRPPEPRNAIPMLGTEAYAAFETAIYLMQEAGYASKHDAFIAKSIAKIMSGGEIVPGTTVSEHYLLELEREAFLKLVGTKESQARIEHMLKTGKPLRN